MDCIKKSFKKMEEIYNGKIKTLTDPHSLNKEDEIRPELKDALEIMEQMFPLMENDLSNICPYSSSFSNLPIIAYRAMSSLEIKFVLKKINGWIESGFKEAKRQLVTLALLDLKDANRKNKKLTLNDEELVSIVVKRDPNYIERLSQYLYNDAVREFFLLKCKEQYHNEKCAYYLGKYYYEQKEYSDSFNFLKNIGGENFYKEKCYYLGLMYYNGKGVKKNWSTAKHFLEEVVEGAYSFDDVTVCALGKIYEQTVSIKKALELYDKVLRNAYYNEKTRFPNLIKRYMDLKEMTTLPDSITIRVNISSKNLNCEFSIELPPHSHALVNWGENKNKLSGALSNNENKIITFRHRYHKPGIYRINIETVCGRTLEGLEFSRYKNQLVSIKFERTPGIQKISIINQRLKSLKLPKSKFLNGLVCRNNRIEKLDLSTHGQLTRLDCSLNPLIELRLAPIIAMTDICLRRTKLSPNDFIEILKLNGRGVVNSISYNDLGSADMPLEYYFKLTNWRKVKGYLIKDHSFDYYRAEFNYKELESVFNHLKQLSNNGNQTPYKKGYLDVYDSFVCDNTIIGAEEFFITEKDWEICMATKVRNYKLCEPWLGIDPPQPEYFVANCMINMINNKSELKKYLYKTN